MSIKREFPATEEYDFRVEATRESGHVDIKCFEEHGIGWTSIVEGHVKWDGCSNLSIGTGCMFHSCGKASALRLAKVIERIYAIAAEMMPEESSTHRDMWE